MAKEERLCNYSIGIAQTDDEIKEKLKFRFYLQSTFSLLDSVVDMPETRCFSTGGRKTYHDAILELFGTTQKIIFSLTCLPSTANSLLSSSLFLLNFKLSSSGFPILIHPIFLGQFLTWPHNVRHRKYSEPNFDLATKCSSKIFEVKILLGHRIVTYRNDLISLDLILNDPLRSNAEMQGQVTKWV